MLLVMTNHHQLVKQNMKRLAREARNIDRFNRRQAEAKAEEEA
jgi:hypothetical protein